MTDFVNDPEIQIFQEYLRIPSVHPNVNYEPCVQFLRRQASALGLPSRTLYPAEDPKNPIVLITWLGSEPLLPSVLLSSHMDVVPVFVEHWTHQPFGAEIDAQGRIFARGAQDMKSVGVQYLAAVRALRKRGVQQLKRTLHIVYVPDEEVGSFQGMKPFVQSSEFRALNIGFALDEGIASATEEFSVFFAERTVWKVQFLCHGTAGHGSLLLKNTATEKLLYCMNRMSEFRSNESKRLDDSNGALLIGDVTTVNLTVFEGGVQSNVVPPVVSALYDMRLALDVDLDAFEETLRKWCREAGDNVQLIFKRKNHHVEATKIDATNPFWVALETTLKDELKLQIKPQIFAGGTDSKNIREVGIPAIGFSPINRTQVLLHDHDEFLAADTYLRGIAIYTAVIERLANV